MSDSADVSSEIRSAVEEFLRRECLPEEEAIALTPSTPLITGGILDSIGAIRLVSYLEDRFGVSFGHGDVIVQNLDTIDRVVETVRQKTIK
jgi:acyl carrier protein